MGGKVLLDKRLDHDRLPQIAVLPGSPGIRLGDWMFWMHAYIKSSIASTGLTSTLDNVCGVTSAASTSWSVSSHCPPSFPFPTYTSPFGWTKTLSNVGMALTPT
jgi:hypothetical protein